MNMEPDSILLHHIIISSIIIVNNLITDKLTTGFHDHYHNKSIDKKNAVIVIYTEPLHSTRWLSWIRDNVRLTLALFLEGA